MGDQNGGAVAYKMLQDLAFNTANQETGNI
jgi:hypothetical protein